MAQRLLAIVELGGYPDFTADYNLLGFDVSLVKSVRKAIVDIKKNPPHVIVTEFNFQSDFRDRTSSLETLMACLQQQKISPKIIVLYEKEYQTKFDILQARFPVYRSLSFPVDKRRLINCLK
mgnify:CR=1 FL=1